ncbi:MAG: type II toxin-antitoxin system RelE/ParE family toxin [Nanoarchaeota archaeon]|nr:type II toxin-antitoxin system RelE/ParE family toxin [Nanoarchaeota archaeon]MBU1975293.1 type II toxin-antitoxin system RelE/ParE family toxin [Nanoarchaeota archaeon]
MSYSIKLHPSVNKFLRKCPGNLADRIAAKFRLLTVDPFMFLESFSESKVYKLRIGDYRALVDVDTNRKIIFIRLIEYRRRIYKKLK